MRDWAGKRYWIIGASEGLGRALAFKMSEAGADLILSGRREEPLQKLAVELSGATQVQVVDVADQTSVDAAVEAIGVIDGMVFLAGVYWPMDAKEWDHDHGIAMADVNFTGQFRVLGRVVPQMVDRGAGHIVLTASLSAFRGLPGAIGYSASKAGILALAESMRCDLRKTGVEVQVTNPGFIRTRLTDKNDFDMPFLMEPDEAADQVFAHMNSRAFKRSFPWLFSMVFRGSQLMPDWLYFRIFG
ncbi:SDR family NAD(P)-dependent oxidoreductase [Primorskyibacter flagellatus]|uniref:Short-chain dehydrogenase n=1 Tax=Primorskyibacter flagellatus TaxID=1387277 RepID=A0A1W2C0I2_9RHOB|nr:SDR family NAD(P)-dependent oxidoreductase [Primorskyibacter flagellatus]SMC78601.1 Short-chain dehydrogenase [Primorskyibacter flagellatus]